MKKVCHIYYNTSGNSGLYLNPINDALFDIYEQVFYVNYYYPLYLQGFRKTFFRLTEKNENNKHKFIMANSTIRKIVRYMELKAGNNRMFHELRLWQPDLVNYSLTNMPDAFKTIKRIKKILPEAKLCVTCHDVLPFHATNGIDYPRIYNFADYLLVHTKNAISILMENYAVDSKKILYHPFPMIDLKLLCRDCKAKMANTLPVFLFIGVMREEKGVQYLIDAWRELGEEFPASLIIAGYKPEDVELDFTSIKNYKNVTLLLKSLSDEEYCWCLNEADYVVFPYSKVGNSGVLSTTVSMHKIPVTTKLPTFLESVYCREELSCEPGDAGILARLLFRITESHDADYIEYQDRVIHSLEDENALSNEMIVKAYNNMLGVDENSC